MRKRLLCGVVLTSGLAWSQPVVTRVVNAASNRAPEFPTSGIAQGALAIAYGTSMGPAELVQASSYPLPTSLGGTSVTITAGGTTVDGILIYASERQVAFIVPSRTPLGPAELRVRYNQQSSAVTPIELVSGNVGIYTWAQDGNGQAVATDGVTNQVITLESPARADEVLNIWSNGLGAAAGDEAKAPSPGDLGGPLEAWMGGQRAEILYRGRSGCCSALDQIVVRVPRDLPASCSLPLYFKRGDAVGNITTLPVGGADGACPDPLGLNGLALKGKDHIDEGHLILERNFEANGAAQDFIHFVFGRYQQQYWNGFEFAPPAIGTCLMKQNDNSSRFDPTRAVALNAGLITLALPNATFRFPRSEFGDYGGPFQGRSPLDFTGNGTLNNGAGAEVPGFSMTLDFPGIPQFRWTEQGSLATVPRAQPLTVSWTGSAPEGIVSVLGSSSGSLNVSFQCRVQGGLSQFTVPPDILALLPAGSGFVNVNYNRPGTVSGKPAALDVFRYEQSIVRGTPVTFR